MTVKKGISFSLFIMVLLIMVQGCSAADYLTFHGDAQRTGYVADAGPLSENIRWSVSPGWIDSSPVVKDGYVYIATIADWNHPEAVPAVFCYDTATGEKVWTYEVGSEAGLTIADDMLIVGGSDGYIYALNTADGTVEWSVQADENPGWFGLSSSPLYYDGLLYQLTPSDGGLHVYDPADGSEEWSVAFGAWDLGWTNATYFTAPAAKDGVVYFPSNLSELYAHDTTTRSEIWNASLDSTIESVPVISTNSLFVTTATTLYELSLADGSTLATRDITGTTSTPALDITSGLLYLGTDDAGLICLDIDDIAAPPVWDAGIAKIAVSPVVAGDYVYAGTNEEQSSLYAFDAADGTEVWSYTLPTPEGDNWASFWGSSPAVADGTLYIGAEYTNTLFAFGPGAACETTVILHEGVQIALTDGTLVNETTGAGAIHAASEACGFTIDTSAGTWGSSLNLLGDMGYDPVTGYYWQQFDNGVASGIGLDAVARDGDTFSFWYSGWGDVLPAETTGVPNLVTVHVTVPEDDIGVFTIADTEVSPGSSFLARLNVTKTSPGWYVIDVSGVDDEGNSLSGLATVELEAATEKTGIPVYVQVPLNTPAGEYELFAAVYTFDTFPYTKPVTSEGIVCTVL
ncbi:outer membrane protein assembly factor BamB family protein [Methanogenium organophilum]|uniref:PQQ-binding-like beta-propeller repeat protein n=1 Tax=Methanogenium organophilum TaxID=2199 RepID=A0A9X9S6N5_METOG|nr:PQQ-binding-like beta-propeller repeat protein [Methanogenium organophilum]WAI02422.1 PQQ-binding-like beta-propeller repeat protein [Methanogenium organophilum]